MPEIVKFKAFCLEFYKYEHKMKGKDAFRLFKEYGVFDYIGEFFDELHSYGHQYLVQDIDEFIEVRQKPAVQKSIAVE